MRLTSAMAKQVAAENTRVRNDGTRGCKTCARMRCRVAARRRRAQEKAAGLA